MNKKIVILGIGKLGICFALNLEAKGFTVLGVDIDEDYVRSINQKYLDSPEPGVDKMLRDSENLKATTNLQEALEFGADMFFLMVATPSTPDGRYDHRQVDRVAENLLSHGKSNKRVELVVVCTTMPGYCDSLAEKLEPYNYHVSYNPEFIAQGSIIKDQLEPDQVLIGEADEEAGQKIENVYMRMVENAPAFCRMDRLSAEICKIATNCFLTTKISFANSIGDLATKAGADRNKILKAIGADSRIGNKYLRYGFGFGGPCFPRDNRALGVFADDQEYELLISKATDEVNRRHLQFMFDDWMQRYPEDATITFEYVSYKKDSVLLEESQQLALAEMLAKAGRKVLIKERKEVIQELESYYGGLFIYELSHSE